MELFGGQISRSLSIKLNLELNYLQQQERQEPAKPKEKKRKRKALNGASSPGGYINQRRRNEKTKVCIVRAMKVVEHQRNFGHFYVRQMITLLQHLPTTRQMYQLQQQISQ
jgi:hypothetical protein